MSAPVIKMNRRQLIKAVGAGIASATFLPACSSQEQNSGVKSAGGTPGIIGADGRRVLPWNNWSSNLSCQPTLRDAPRSEEQLISTIKESKQAIRCVGSGHSFSPLVPTEETLISLSRLRGKKKVNKQKKQVTFGAGTLLGQTGEPLWDEGFGLINMPDIDTQSLAGSIATSTHGTGADLGSISMDVVGLRLITAQGDIVNCSREQESRLFHAARNHLGALGVLSEVTLQVRDRYKTEEKKWFVKNDVALKNAEQLRDANRHFEMFAFPHADYMMMLTINETDKEIHKPEFESSDGAMLEMKKWAERLPWIKSYIINSGLKDAAAKPEQRVDRSYEVFGNLRSIRFNEMEYSVPAEVGVECLNEILHTIKNKNIDVIFPIEFRYVKGDDVWLSPFYQRDSCTISCHNFADRGFKEYFAAVEPIFLKYGGRPHWGKIHNLNANDFSKMYEKWADFKQVRKEFDPDGLFLNKHIKELFVS